MNSRDKGKRGERQWRDELRANGYTARRGQQFAGGPESPDVVCDELKWAHMEVKCTERFNIYDAMDQAARDAGASRTGHQKVPFVMHKRNFRRWLVVMDAETFFKFLTGELPPGDGTNGTDRTDDGAQGTARPTQTTDGSASHPYQKIISDVAGESPDTVGDAPALAGSKEQTEQTEQ